MKFQALQPNNPILRAEINYQRRVTPRWLQWFDRTRVIIVALFVPLGLTLFLISKYDLWNIGHGQELLTIILPLLWATQLVVILRSLLAGFSIGQDFTDAHQSDIFIFTGVSTQKVLIGKYWSVMYQLRGWIVGFGIVMLTVVAMTMSNFISFRYFAPAHKTIEQTSGQTIVSILYDVQFGNYVGQYLPTTARIVLVVSHTLAITILEVIASAAVGIMGGLIAQRAIGLTLTVIYRFAPVVIFSMYPDYPNAYGAIYWRWHEYTWFAFADGGSTGIIRSVVHFFRHYREPDMITPSALLAFWAAIIMFLIYIIVSLYISHTLLRRRGFLSASSI